MHGDPDLSVRRVRRASRSRTHAGRLRDATVVLPRARTPWWRRPLALTLGAIVVALGAGGWWLSRPVPLGEGDVLWTVDLAAAGSGPSRALVVGGAGGARVLRIPGAGDTTAVPLRLVARPDVSPLRVIALGGGAVELRATPAAGPAGPERRARARVVTLRAQDVTTGF